MEITNINQLDPLYGVYSYADYLLWKFKERVELFKGKLFKMSAPSAVHQEISMKLAGELYQFLKGSSNMPFMRKLKYQNIGLLTPITKIFWYIY
ncbi:Uncharacterised protein [Capnocytophaga ochracea]|jgi:hypothetical protein|uniref:Restriction endonuclease domain-containing protein n=1 Tax=Capnocytophaga ochracea TaxID=1018 RepID=A0A2X2UUG3_CAPOC|nr:Uncharacterised protein [Capnocytophaga ochracea]